MTATQTPLRCQTRYFGTVDYHEASVLIFPEGIPAFEQERRFVAIRQPINEPLVFLQSLATPELCFVVLPVSAVCRGYRLSLAPEDLEQLGLDSDRQPADGREVLALAIVSIEENGPPTANLLAPIIVNLATRCARQAIQTDCPFSHQEPLPLREAACS
jgi:flagellar assembly factor FliW